MLHFLFGGAGSGKSTEIARRITEDLRAGRRVLLLVPEQQTVASEGDYAALDLGGRALDLEISNFTRLADSVFRRFGGLSYRYIGRGAQLLLMWKTLEAMAPVLTTFRSVTLSDSAFLERMLTTVRDLKRSRISSDQLEEASHTLGEAGHGAVSGKLHDLSLIAAAYDGLLRNGYDDPAEDLTRLAATLEEHDYFHGIRVYLDAFSGFDAAEYEVLAHILRQAESVTVTLCHDPYDPSDVFAEAKKTVTELKRLASRVGVGIGETVCLTGSLRFLSEELRFLERHLFRQEKAVYDAPCEAIAVGGFEDDFAAADAVACAILRRVTEDGLRFGEIAVICRRAETYSGILDAALENRGIPCFLSRREPLEGHAVTRFVLSALTVAAGSFATHDVIAYAQSRYAGLAPDRAALFENYVTAWRIRGKRFSDGAEWNMNPDGYTEKLTERGKAVLAAVDEARRTVIPPLVKLADSLLGGCTVKEAATALWTFLEETNVKEAVAETEEVPVWNGLLAALDSMVEVLPDQSVTAESFGRMLKAVLSCTDMGRIPRTSDEVLIGSAPMIRANGVRDVFLFGLNHGEFPATPDAGGLFSGRDLELLRENGVELYDGEEAALDAELSFFYRAACSASERLTLVYVNAGGDSHGSYFCAGTAAMFPHHKIFTVAAEDTVWCPADGVGYAMRSGSSPLGRALEPLCAASPEAASQLAAARAALDPVPAVIGRDLAAELFGGDLYLTQSRLDRFLDCPFSYYGRYILKLAELQKPDFDRRDTGNFVHHALELFMRDAIEKKTLLTMTDAEIETAAHGIVASCVRSVMGEGAQPSHRLNRLFERLSRTVCAALRDMVGEFRNSRFLPALCEFPIGYGGGEHNVPPLKIPLDDRSGACMTGIADRVDVCRLDGDDALYVRIVDYKTGEKSLSRSDVQKGKNLQMLLYLFALWKDPGKTLLSLADSGQGASRIRPAGAMYYIARNTDELCQTEYGEAADPADEVPFTRSGLFSADKAVRAAMETPPGGKYLTFREKTAKSDGNLLDEQEMEDLLAEVSDKVSEVGRSMKRGLAEACPRPMGKGMACDYCDLRPLCRHVRRRAADGNEEMRGEDND